MKNLKIILIVILVILVLFATLLILRGDEDTWLCQDGEWVRHGHPSALIPEEPCGENIINNFNDCVLAGNPVMESYPRQCRANNQTFVEDVMVEEEFSGDVIIDQPVAYDIVSSPLIVSGQARGTWFFEAVMPIKLVDADGNVITSHYVTAQTDWMTEDFVPFMGELEFSVLPDTSGFLIIEKANPSDLPENSGQYSVPINF